MRPGTPRQSSRPRQRSADCSRLSARRGPKRRMRLGAENAKISSPTLSGSSDRPAPTGVSDRPFGQLGVQIVEQQQRQNAGHRDRAQGDGAHEGRRFEQAKIDERRLEAPLHLQQCDKAAAASTAKPARLSGALVTAGNAWSAETNAVMKIANSTKPIQSNRPTCRAVAPRTTHCAPDNQAAGGGHEHGHATRPEDHAPVQVVGESAADQRTQAKSQHQEARPGADRRRATFRVRSRR